jgi:uncharacterized repeat protein (TIGR01451 family)
VLEVADVSSGEEITTFVKPLTVTIEYTDGDLNGQDEDTLELMYWNGDAWVTDGITIVERDTVDNRLVGAIEHLTEFALFGQYNVKFEIDKVYESSRVAGTVVTYTLTITNTGIDTATGVIVSDTIPAYLTDVITEEGTLQLPFVWWELGSIAPDGGTATTGFRATLPCTAGLSIVNDDYGVRWSDQGVSGTVGAAVTFTVLAPTLSPAFDQSATEVDAGETVYFTDTSTTNGAPIFARAWGFGDGATASGPSTNHTYTQTGEFTVTLTVIDTCGFSDSTVVSNAVIVSPLTNTAPTLSGLPNQIFDHSTGPTSTIDLWAYASDAETPVSELTYTIEGTPPAGAGVTLEGNRYVTVNPSTNWCGRTDVTIRVTDPGGLWDTDTFRVAVTWSCQGPLPVPGQHALRDESITIDLTPYEPQVGAGGRRHGAVVVRHRGGPLHRQRGVQRRRRADLHAAGGLRRQRYRHAAYGLSLGQRGHARAHADVGQWGGPAPRIQGLPAGGGKGLSLTAGEGGNGR